MKPLRYLLVGGFNTAFGYFATVGLYYSLSKYLHILIIGVLANVVCITVSFASYKIFVFKSRASWLREYLRSYVVYGTSAVVGIVGLWILVDGLGIRFWLAQGGLMVIGVTISYIGHDRFTFKNKG